MKTHEDIILSRLSNQSLLKASNTGAYESVRLLGAIQAQEYWGGLWSIGIRTGLTKVQVEESIAKSEIIRTWPMRGTIHFVPGEDAHWMQELMALRVINKYQASFREVRLSEDEIERSAKLLISELKGRSLTRKEIYEILENSGISTKDQRGYYILVVLAQKSIICFGKMRNKQPTFVLLEGWAPDQIELSQVDALTEIALRYFWSHGPATTQDFMWWSGLKSSEVKDGIEKVGDKLDSFIFEDKRYYQRNRQVIEKNKEIVAHLLPPYDELIIGYKDRRAMIDPAFINKVNLGLTNSPVMINGKGVGIWKKVIRSKTVEISITLFRSVSVSEKKALDKAAHSFANFLELEPVILYI